MTDPLVAARTADGMNLALARPSRCRWSRKAFRGWGFPASWPTWRATSPAWRPPARRHRSWSRGSATSSCPSRPSPRARSAARSMGSSVGREILRGVLGSMFGGRR